MTIPSPNHSTRAAQALLRHRAMLGSFIYSIVRNVERTEDLIQDLAVVVIQKWEKFQEVENEGAYLREIARRLIMAEARKSSRIPKLLPKDIIDEIEVTFNELDDASHGMERQEALNHCLGRLQPKQRQLVEMRYLENRTYEDLAEVFGGTINRIRVILCRVRKGLAQCAEQFLTPGAVQ